MQIVIRRGRDIRMAGRPVQSLGRADAVAAVALQGSDYPDLHPDFRVETGDQVRAGEILFVDRKRPQIAFTSPASGTIASISRGRRRTLDAIVVKCGGGGEKEFAVPTRPDDASVRALLLESGLWPAFRTRPFERIPEPGATPRAIFVTAIDTNPLAADPAVVLAPDAAPFEAGLARLAVLTEGPVFVCQAPGPHLAEHSDRIRVVEFRGPHPAGLPGTHIHHLMPAGRDREVWHIGYQDVVAIGRLFATGRVPGERIVALGGPGMREPRLLRTLLGADIDHLVEGELRRPDATVLSGSVLSGRPSRYLGRYHLQVTALEQGGRLHGLAGRLAGFFASDPADPIIPVAAYERVMALDILPVPLLRALSVGDAATAERLGCLELAEEDMALLSHVCAARSDYGPLLRRVLNEIWTPA